jgi:hypothetical protein
MINKVSMAQIVYEMEWLGRLGSKSDNLKTMISPSYQINFLSNKYQLHQLSYCSIILKLSSL